MTNVLQTLDYLVKNYSTFENFITTLKNIHQENIDIIYGGSEYNKDAWKVAVQTAEILENLDILLGKVKLEDIKEASRTFKPKMDSSI